VTLQAGVALFDFTHNGSRNFIVWLRGASDDLLVNKIGGYRGTTMSGVLAGEFLLDIKADGAWTLTLREPRDQVPVGVPHTATGTGDAVSSFISLDGLYIVTANYTGSRNFIVWLYDADGQRIDLVFNKIGAYSGVNTIRVNSGSYILVVKSSGDWTILVE
jgi:hypothetical protein